MNKLIKAIRTTVAIFLIVCFIGQMPIKAAVDEIAASLNKAAVTQQKSDSDKEDKNENTNNKKVKVLGECIEKRGETFKYFYNGTSEMIYADYGTPVHFLDSSTGKWEDYDNTLVEDGSEELESTYSNKKSDKDIKLSQKSKEQNMVSINFKDAKISWGYQGVEKQKIKIFETVKNSVDKEDQKTGMELENLIKKAKYSDVFKNVDIECTITPEGVKDNIILKSNDTQKEFVINYDIGKLTAEQTDSTTIELKDSNKKTVYILSAPLMIDAKGEQSSALTFKIISQKNRKLTALLTADNEWLEKEDRTYPVQVDPYVIINHNSSTIKCSTVSSNSPTINGSTFSYSFFSAGRIEYDTGYDIRRTYINFDMPLFEPGAMITNANFAFVQDSAIGTSTQPLTADIHDVFVAGDRTADFDINNVTWNNQPTEWQNWPYIEDYTAMGSYLDNQTVYFDITKVVKKWYLEDRNRTKTGFVIKSSDETQYGVTYFCSLNYTDSNYRPIIQITYLHNGGVEDYWSYNMQSIGIGGTSFVDRFTGDLTHIVSVLSCTGNMNPASISFAYSGYRAGQQLVNGKGWRMNVSRRIEAVSDMSLLANGFVYVLTDSDGTKHYFTQKEGPGATFVDEEGLGMTMTDILSDGTHEFKIEYKDGRVEKYSGMTPTGYSRLLEEEDAYERKITYTYDSNYKLTSITDGSVGSGRVTSITYNASGLIQTITYDNKTTTMTYDNGKLDRITYFDNTYVDFDYDSSERLTKVTNFNGIALSYTYGTNTTYAFEANRVVKTCEYSGTTAGRTVIFSYGNDNTTKITYDKLSNNSTTQSGRYDDDVVESYVFDNYGMVTSVVGDNECTNYSYQVSGNGTTSESSSMRNKNKVNQASTTIKGIDNLLSNHSVEMGESGWTTSNWYGYNATFARVTTEKYLGNYSLSVASSVMGSNIVGYSQELLNLTPGETYTLSAYMKTSNVFNVSSTYGAGIYAAYYNGSTRTSASYSRGIQGTNDWQRITLTFTVPVGTTSVRIHGGLIYGSGTAYFDCFQLEKGSYANDYNMLENPQFNTTSTWSMSSGVTISSGDATVTGSKTEDRGLMQNVFIKKQGVCMYMSGKGRAYAVPDNIDGRKFELNLTVYYTDGTNQNFVAKFNADSRGYQYASSPIVTDKTKTVNYVSFRTFYNRNTVNAVFDDLTLVIDETGTTYGYDNKGNVESSTDNADRNQTYTYNDVDTIASYTNDNSEVYEYKYVSDVYGGASSRKDNYKLSAVKSNQRDNGVRYLYDANSNVSAAYWCRTNTDDYFNTAAPYILAGNYTYTADGNYILSSSNSRGKTTQYVVHSGDGALDYVTDPKGNSTDYNYDSYDRLSSVSSGGTTISYDYDAKNRLKNIIHNGFRYEMNYDIWGNLTNVAARKVNDNSYVMPFMMSSYYSNNGLLSQVMSPVNGDRKNYFYDKYDRLTSMTRNSVQQIANIYNARSQLVKRTDFVTGISSEYTYDLIGRLTGRYSSGNNTVKFTYDNLNRLTEAKRTVGDSWYNNSYSYLPDSLNSSVGITTSSGTMNLMKFYDALNRPNGSLNLLSGNGSRLSTAITYKASGLSTYGTTGLVETYTSKLISVPSGGDQLIGRDTYSYDDNGNISNILNNITGQNIEYVYDSKNQLVRVNNRRDDQTIIYSYDNGGNILEKKIYDHTTAEPIDINPNSTITYSYGGTNWKSFVNDLLVNYNGETKNGSLVEYTYDSILNPLTYRDGTTMTWSMRDLKTVSKTGLSASYSYNADGFRVSKTVNGVTTQFILDDSGNILKQTSGSNTLLFIYDDNGSRVGVQYNGANYLYVYNAQGDVTAIVDANHNVVVSYTYDEWGNKVSVTGSMASTLGVQNPFRYRGYCYDEETGWYYLQSRYYDPVVGRFISADDRIAGVGGNPLGYNLYAYCFNNPVNMSDPSGHWAQLIETIVNVVKKGVEAGIVQHDVPLYTQKGPLCWAYSQTMVEDFQSGTTKTEAEADARAREIAVSRYGEDDWEQAGWPTNMGDWRAIDSIGGLLREVRNGPVYGYYSGDGGAHLIVVTGVNIWRREVYTNNPWGISGTQTYDEFLSYFAGGSTDMPFGSLILIN